MFFRNCTRLYSKPKVQTSFLSCSCLRISTEIVSAALTKCLTSSSSNSDCKTKVCRNQTSPYSFIGTRNRCPSLKARAQPRVRLSPTSPNSSRCSSTRYWRTLDTATEVSDSWTNSGRKSRRILSGTSNTALSCLATNLTLSNESVTAWKLSSETTSLAPCLSHNRSLKLLATSSEWTTQSTTPRGLRTFTLCVRYQRWEKHQNLCLTPSVFMKVIELRRSTFRTSCMRWCSLAASLCRFCTKTFWTPSTSPASS